MDGEDADLAKVWRDDRWLMSNDLDEKSVLVYFKLSDWYDDDCEYSGIHYEVALSQGGRLFVINKVERAGERSETLGAYYVLDGNVFQCVPVRKLIESKLLLINRFLADVVTETASHYSFSLAGGHTLNPSSESLPAPKPAEAAPVLAFGAASGKSGTDKEAVEESRLMGSLIRLLNKTYPQQGAGNPAPSHPGAAGGRPGVMEGGGDSATAAAAAGQKRIPEPNRAGQPLAKKLK